MLWNAAWIIRFEWNQHDELSWSQDSWECKITEEHCQYFGGAGLAHQEMRCQALTRYLKTGMLDQAPMTCQVPRTTRRLGAHGTPLSGLQLILRVWTSCHPPPPVPDLDLSKDGFAKMDKCVVRLWRIMLRIELRWLRECNPKYRSRSFICLNDIVHVSNPLRYWGKLKVELTRLPYLIFRVITSNRVLRLTLPAPSWRQLYRG